MTHGCQRVHSFTRSFPVFKSSIYVCHLRSCALRATNTKIDIAHIIDEENVPSTAECTSPHANADDCTSILATLWPIFLAPVESRSANGWDGWMFSLSLHSPQSFPYTLGFWVNSLWGEFERLNRKFSWKFEHSFLKEILLCSLISVKITFM